MNTPNLIGSASVVCYTLTSGNVLNTYGLAICKYSDENGFYLFRCNSDWVDFSDTWHQSIDDAQDQADYEYQNELEKWIFV